MAKRISIKGRGADIFFGDYSPESSQDSPADEVPVSDTESASPAEVSPPPVTSIAIGDVKQEGLQESLHARKKARKKDSKDASLQASKQEATDSTLPANQALSLNILGSILPTVSRRATVTNAFRYTEQELSHLEDVLYEITKRFGIKLSKQDIARLGLNAVLSDYEHNGETSILAEFAQWRKNREGR